MPAILMTTEIGKAAESDTCEKAFILSRAIISYPSSTAYDFVSKEYNHLLIKDARAPKHHCQLCANNLINVYDDKSIHIAGRCYEMSCGLNSTYFTLGTTNYTSRLQPIIQYSP